MPFGTFLDTWPKWLFISFHAVFFLVGLWAYMTAKKQGAKYAPAFLLYALVHVGFALYLWDVFTIRMSVLVEQMLILVMVLWIVMKGKTTTPPPSSM